jgi:cation diffusion facilitator family transporter
VDDRAGRARRAIRSVQGGLAVNATLALTKLVAGLVGNSYALVADAVESTTDIFSSLIVWSGLRIASRAPDDDYPFGYGKAEPLAGAIVSLMLLAAALGIAVKAAQEIVTPHHAPAAFTLAVLSAVIVIKEVLYRRVFSVGAAVGSTAVKADAWHHRSDAITSGAAFVGIGVALWGGAGWESADDWAALAAAVVIVYNGLRMLRPSVQDLMDRTPGEDLVRRIAKAAVDTEGVRAVEKLRVRRAGLGYYADIHVQAEPTMPLRDAHVLSGRVKGAIRSAVPEVTGVLVHMEPYELPR